MAIILENTQAIRELPGYDTSEDGPTLSETETLIIKLLKRMTARLVGVHFPAPEEQVGFPPAPAGGVTPAPRGRWGRGTPAKREGETASGSGLAEMETQEPDQPTVEGKSEPADPSAPSAAGTTGPTPGAPEVPGTGASSPPAVAGEEPSASEPPASLSRSRCVRNWVLSFLADPPTAEQVAAFRERKAGARAAESG